MANSIIVTADSNLVLPAGTCVMALIHTANTAGTESGYDFYDAINITPGTVVLRSRVLSIGQTMNFGPRGIRFDVGVSIDKTGAGDGTLTVIYQSRPFE